MCSEDEWDVHKYPHDDNKVINESQYPKHCFRDKVKRREEVENKEEEDEEDVELVEHHQALQREQVSPDVP